MQRREVVCSTRAYPCVYKDATVRRAVQARKVTLSVRHEELRLRSPLSVAAKEYPLPRLQ